MDTLKAHFERDAVRGTFDLHCPGYVPSRDR